MTKPTPKSQPSLSDATAEKSRTDVGSGVKVRFWSGASVVHDAKAYFGGEPRVKEQLEFYDWLKDQEQQRRSHGD